MKRTIIACGTIRDDIEPIIESINYEAEVIWLDKNLHAVPQNLNTELQKTIDSLSECDEIILTYLLCGNALLGLHSDTSILRFIKGDDCIYADLCLRDDYKDLRCSSFFLSHGWMNTERNIIVEYQKTIEKYGEKRGKHIWDVMYRNYKHLAYMQLQEDDILTPEEEDRINTMAEYANVDVIRVKGSTLMYEKLLFLEDDPAIAVIEKGHTITLEDTKAF